MPVKCQTSCGSCRLPPRLATRGWLPFLGLAVAFAAAAAAQPVKLGVEFQVNVRTSADQEDPAVAIGSQGNFVVVWSSRYQDGFGTGVFGRRFSSSGTPLGVEFQVNVYTVDSQGEASVASEEDGDFVVAWRSDVQDGDEGGIFARRFNSAGVAQGGEIAVNVHTVSQQVEPLVAARNGGFVVVWASYQQDGSAFGTFGRRFDAAGVALGGEIRINEFTVNDQFQGGVGIADSGSFVVSWSSAGQDGYLSGVFARRFASDGSALGGEFQVNTSTSNYEGSDALAVAGSGEFVIAWTSSLMGTNHRIFVRRFDPTGAALDAERQISVHDTQAFKVDPVVAIDDGGDFVVAWTSGGQDGDGSGVFARHLGRNGAPEGGEVQVSTFTVGNQGHPAVAMSGAGAFVVAWDSYLQDGSDDGVFAQRFAPVIALDIDGDGAFLPLTDGLLVLRYGFGFRGATLIANAVGAGCTRCTAPSIEAHLAIYAE
jgi:hypothetical protein